jgi:ABC-type multidrug transport system ATPase subunit
MNIFRERAKEKKGIMMIASHRLDYINADDMIIYIQDNGQCVSGCHSQLLDSCVSYRLYYQNKKEIQK